MKSGTLTEMLADDTAAIEAVKAAKAAVSPLVRAQEKQAIARVRQAYATRDPKHAMPTGVRLQRQDGGVLDIYDDGSQRHAWKRKPGLSGRQFRNLRKQVNRKLKQQARETAPKVNP